MYIFIDTNIYLDYFRMSNDTIISLKRLKEFINKNRKVKLVLPLQIQNEFYRNKNAEIKKSFTRLDDAVNVLTNLSRLSAVSKIEEEVERFRKEFKASLTDKNSEINKLIDSLFVLANNPKEDDDIFNKAYKRMIKGNPPGKPGSIGDAIAWEILLQNCNTKPLYVISKDGDWSEANSEELNSILVCEWKKVSSNKIVLFKSIGEFLNSVNKAKISKQVIKEEKSVPYLASRPTYYEQSILFSNPTSHVLTGYIDTPGTTTFSVTPNNYQGIKINTGEFYAPWASGVISPAGHSPYSILYPTDDIENKKKKEE